MIYEVATLSIVPDRADEFVTAFPGAASIVRAAPGVRHLALRRGVEEPATFILDVSWDSLEAHESFRDSAAFGDWRAEIGPFLQQAPTAGHYVAIC